MSRKKTDWERGYFCAVAMLILQEGLATTAATSLFKGADWTKADPEDIDTFRQYGLISEVE